jgi:hypothetical protein
MAGLNDREFARSTSETGTTIASNFRYIRVPPSLFDSADGSPRLERFFCQIWIRVPLRYLNLLRGSNFEIRASVLISRHMSFVTAFNPVRQEFGRTFCRMDRRVPYGLASTQL